MSVLAATAMKDSLDRNLGEEGGLENSLPQPFVESMRTLFDILDDQQTGRVKFSDIERRWHEDEDCSTSGLPAGVLDSLRVVTPQDGFLSFSRFCKGLQICLLRSKSGNPALVPLSNSSQSSAGSSDGNKFNTRGTTSFGNSHEDIPPALPPPPPPHDPAPTIPYHDHAIKPFSNGKNYTDDCRTQTKLPTPLQPHGKSSMNQASLGQGSKVSSVTWGDSGNSSRPPLAVEPPLLTHRATSRPTQACDDKGGGGLRYQYSKMEDGVMEYKLHYDANPKLGVGDINGYSHYNNANNDNISAAMSRLNQYSGSSNSDSSSANSAKSSPRKVSSNISTGMSNRVAISRRPYGTLLKNDIRMGTGAMLSIHGNIKANSFNSDGFLNGGEMAGQNVGPPKPPRTLESQPSEGSLAKKLDQKKSIVHDDHSSDSSSQRVENIVNKMKSLSSNLTGEKIYDKLGGRSSVSSFPRGPAYSLASSRVTATQTDMTACAASSKANLVLLPLGSHPSHLCTGTSQFPSSSRVGLGGYRAAAALPLSLPSGYSLQRSQTHSHITTHSLERDARRQAHEAPGVRMRRRGGSLERLLDGPPAPQHSRESSADTTATAPLQRHDWPRDDAPSRSNGVNGYVTAAFPSRYHHTHLHQQGTEVPAQQQLREKQLQPALNLQSHKTNAPFSSNVSDGKHSGVARLPYPQQQQHLHQLYRQQQQFQQLHYHQHPQQQHRQNKQVLLKQQQCVAEQRPPLQLPQSSPGGAGTTDHRSTMSSYAWIRGADDGSTSDGSGDGRARLAATHATAAHATTTHATTTHATSTATAGHVTVTPATALITKNTEAATTSDADGGGAGRAGHRKGRRRDARRHTLQHGLDYAAVRRAGALEAERDMLHQGLQAVEQARQWYRGQLQRLLYSLHTGAHTAQPFDSEAQQQKLHYQLARITEVNTQLSALMNASQMPHHLALASTTTTATTSAPPPGNETASEEQAKVDSQMKRLRDQNHQLTEEVGQKSQHIAVLEQDKSRLLRELFQARAVATAGLQAHGQADSTFM